MNRRACIEGSILVIAKAPIPGRVKTRLHPPCTLEEAARIAEAALADTLRSVAATPIRRRILILDGPPGRWIPSGFEVHPQGGGGLDERLAAAFEFAGDGPAVLIGMDTPQVRSGTLGSAIGLLTNGGHDAVLGRAVDGGWWAIGLRRPDPRVFLGVPMSTSETGRAQIERLRRLGLRWSVLPTLRDVDRWVDALAVAERIPGSAFARAVSVVAGRIDGSTPEREPMRDALTASSV